MLPGLGAYCSIQSGRLTEKPKLFVLTPDRMGWVTISSDIGILARHFQVVIAAPWGCWPDPWHWPIAQVRWAAIGLSVARYTFHFSSRRGWTWRVSHG